MEFTEPYKQTGPCCFSPDARFLAVAVDYRLVVRDVLSLKVVQLFSCVDKISSLEWAPDSEYILCGLYKRPMVQAWSLSQPDWTCKIDEGPAGIAYARWSPDSRHILTTSEFQLRLTVWSLVNTACVHVQWPKHASRGVSFTKDGKFAAICTRRDCKDYINLLSCHSWEIMSVFAVDTVDLAGVEWSPDDSAIVVWDSLLEYKVLIYSPDGRCLFKYLAYESGLGVKSVAWSPCGQFLAVGSYDQAVRTLNHLTWKTFAEFTHTASIRSPCNAAIFKEVDDPWQLDMSELCLSEGFSRNMQDNGAENGTEGGGSRVKYSVMDVPITLPSTKPATDKPNPKQGIGELLLCFATSADACCESGVSWTKPATQKLHSSRKTPLSHLITCCSWSTEHVLSLPLELISL
ncbi:WD repeat-containing protein WRAP73 [Panicum miliaceum]|uniref:WD repeat-containing protein WRAP73 n=1 Tax=Panicum miliaceum TaxID=4540 RepID=A0A3L6TRP2_PANMI|nr:WD repeat-containing protein WRAP73 [Panicum miliaceum]